MLQTTPTPPTHTTPEQEIGSGVSYELFDNGMGVYGMDVKSDYSLPVYAGDLKWGFIFYRETNQPKLLL